MNQINLKEYGDFYGFHLDIDDSAIHEQYNIFRGTEAEKTKRFRTYRTMNAWYSKMFGSAETMKYGLFFEMMRYLFGVFPEVYDFHKVSDPENELKMEVWGSDFDRNLNVILDRLNLIDSPENRVILEENGLSDVDIGAERQRLYLIMKEEDASMIHKNEDRRLIRSGHIHSGRNNTEYVEALLIGIDPGICLLLKHITNVIEYGWSHSQYC